jgi:hypothetical protein
LSCLVLGERLRPAVLDLQNQATDLADAVKIDDLRQSAVITAVFVWQAAMRDETFPRRGR